MSLAPDLDKTAAVAVELVGKIMGGARAKSLPWQDGPGELVVNLKVASRLKIAVPAATLEQAKVIR